MYTGKEIPALHPCMLFIHTNISIYQHVDWVSLITFFLPEVSISPEPSREAVGTSTSCPAPTLTSHWQHGWHSPSGSIGSNQSTKKSQQSTELFPKSIKYQLQSSGLSALGLLLGSFTRTPVPSWEDLGPEACAGVGDDAFPLWTSNVKEK